MVSQWLKMGSGSSASDNIPLVENDESKEDVALFEKLDFVIIGYHGAGKNKAGNIILNKKEFSYWTSWSKQAVKKESNSGNHKITVIRTPGWSGKLRTETKQQILKSVQSSFTDGPNALLLVIKIGCTDSLAIFTNEEGKSMFEEMFTENVWENIIVLFTNEKGLMKENMPIDEYITKLKLDWLIEKCEGRYFCLSDINSWKVQSRELIYNLEVNIAEKKNENFNMEDIATENKLKKKTSLKKNLEKKYNQLKSHLPSYRKNKKKCESIEIKIEKLEKIIKQKTEEIQELQAQIDQLSSEVKKQTEEDKETKEELKQTKEELKQTEEELKQTKEELKQTKEESKQTKEELKQTKEELKQTKEESKQTKEESKQTKEESKQTKEELKQTKEELKQTQETLKQTQETLKQTQETLKQTQDKLTSTEEMSTNRITKMGKWQNTLHNILCELLEDEFKKLKHFLTEIPSGKLEHAKQLDVTDMMIKAFGFNESITKTRDLMKKIPRNDPAVQDMLEPFLSAIGEAW
ncbi:uncharacterized protein PF3D7_1120000-like [Oncorhynchus keta]|uniref:uncharacterized protein PF3D7_1120000-like n=1 Tax=Oncorhynchus keta TaxID=8018 RepID=UPI00227CBC4C|nr:uncharacterized protein PF3D7_1120000-like [Oncorhynchus keta]XP_052353318.1 uncharacterized protein PF3D7_1120000-like [Oncorhynchus keta]XP_052353319.1 uncharacterized protein PF3D7_1120000-like [Oncorhynchus keta]